MSEETFRIAVIGAGRMGRVHIARARALERGRGRRAWSSRSRLRAGELARRGLRTFTTAADLLTDGEIDGVLIAAPTDQHVELVEMLAGAGVPVLCEKPVGTRAADAVAAAAAVERAGIAFQVGYWRRFVPELRALRERIADGELGEILQISCLQWDAEPPSAQFRAHSGGIAVDMAVHELDQARWLTGQEISSVTAMPGGGDDQLRSDPDAATIVARLVGRDPADRLGRADLPRRRLLLGRGVRHRTATSGSRSCGARPATQVFRSCACRARPRHSPRAVRGGGAGRRRRADAVAALTAAELAKDALARRPWARGAAPA